MKEKTTIYVCDYFSKEILSIANSLGDSNTKVKVFPSNCGRPPLKNGDLNTLIEDNKKGQNCIFGSTCVHKLDNKSDTSRVLYFNTCFDMVLNKSLVDFYTSEGSYLLTPGWLINWEKEIAQWGFDSTSATVFFNESCKNLLLLDTGIIPNISSYLKEFAAFINKPCSSLPVGLDYLTSLVSNAISDLNDQQYLMGKRQVTDYSMMMDLLNDLAESHNENEVIGKIVSLFSILFAPRILYFLQMNNDKPGKLVSPHEYDDDDEIIDKLLESVKEEKNNSSGFSHHLIHKGELLGIIYIDEIAFPQYIEHYQNLALSVLKICSLVISNARTYELITNQRDQLTSALTDLKDTQDLLVESQKMAALGNLVAGVAHEINTPISIGITATSDFQNKVNNLENNFNTGKLTKSNFEKSLTNFRISGDLILKNLNRASDLISSFKLVSVDETSERHRQFTLASYINDIVISVEHQLKTKNILTTIVCNKSIKIDSYPGVLAQIFTNFFINSIKHAFNTNENNIVTITGKLLDDTVEIIYTDNGIGVSNENIKKIFDPFFTTDKQEGSGLGLHIVYNLVTQKLMGNISCKSELNKGIAFKLTIPLSIETNEII